MNATIQGIIDLMFKETVDNAETRALHEELLNNCQEHYEDLIAHGMSETEAIDAVVDSLKGMKEVIDEYPKKAGAGLDVKAAEMADKKDIPTINVESSVKQEPEQEKPAEYIFSISDIRTLKTDLKNCDLEIGTSADEHIHVRCEDMDQLICRQEGSVLTLRIQDTTKQSIEEAGKKLNSQEFSLKGLLNFLGKTIGSVASSISVSWNVYVDLPETALAEMNLSSKSGDIHVKSVLPEQMTIHSMSGDIDVDARNDIASQKVTVSTMSGEIEFNGNADAVTMSSMSGDVKAYGSYRNVVIKSTSGDVKLSGEAITIQANSVSGDVETEIKNTTVSSIQAHTTSGDVDVDLAPGNDSVHAMMSTVSGSASCRIPDSGLDAKLQISAKSVSGDVTIK